MMKLIVERFFSYLDMELRLDSFGHRITIEAISNILSYDKGSQHESAG